MPADNSASSLSPFVKKEIAPTAPVTFFGQKQLPDSKVDAATAYKEYNVTMDRLEEGIAAEKERRSQALLAKD